MICHQHIHQSSLYSLVSAVHTGRLPHTVASSSSFYFIILSHSVPLLYLYIRRVSQTGRCMSSCPTLSQNPFSFSAPEIVPVGFHPQLGLGLSLVLVIVYWGGTVVKIRETLSLSRNRTEGIKCRRRRRSPPFPCFPHIMRMLRYSPMFYVLLADYQVL